MNRNIKSLLFLAVFILMAIIQYKTEKNALDTKPPVKAEKKTLKNNGFTASADQPSQRVFTKD